MNLAEEDELELTVAQCWGNWTTSELIPGALTQTGFADEVRLS